MQCCGVEWVEHIKHKATHTVLGRDIPSSIKTNVVHVKPQAVKEQERKVR